MAEMKRARFMISVSGQRPWKGESFRPEMVFESFFGGFECWRFLNEVQVGEETDDFGKPCDLKML